MSSEESELRGIYSNEITLLGTNNFDLFMWFWGLVSEKVCKIFFRHLVSHKIMSGNRISNE